MRPSCFGMFDIFLKKGRTMRGVTNGIISMNSLGITDDNRICITDNVDCITAKTTTTGTAQ